MHRHRDRPRDLLAALFAAYSLILDRLDIPALIRDLGPAGDEDDCRRCGSCCAELVPDPVLPADIERWKRAGNPLALFYAPETGSGPAVRWTGWTFKGARLRLCPFLLWHPEHGDTFCALHSKLAAEKTAGLGDAAAAPKSETPEREGFARLAQDRSKPADVEKVHGGLFKFQSAQEMRPEACSGFVPHYPHCAICQRPLVW